MRKILLVFFGYGNGMPWDVPPLEQANDTPDKGVRNGTDFQDDHTVCANHACICNGFRSRRIGWHGRDPAGYREAHLIEIGKPAGRGNLVSNVGAMTATQDRVEDPPSMRIQAMTEMSSNIVVIRNDDYYTRTTRRLTSRRPVAHHLSGRA